MVATLGQRVHRIRADSRRKNISKRVNAMAIPQQIGLPELSWRWLVVMVKFALKGKTDIKVCTHRELPPSIVSRRGNTVLQ